MWLKLTEKINAPSRYMQTPSQTYTNERHKLPDQKMLIRKWRSRPSPSASGNEPARVPPERSPKIMIDKKETDGNSTSRQMAVLLPHLRDAFVGRLFLTLDIWGEGVARRNGLEERLSVAWAFFSVVVYICRLSLRWYRYNSCVLVCITDAEKEWTHTHCDTIESPAPILIL